MTNTKLITIDTLKTILPVLEDSISTKLDKNTQKPVEPAEGDIPSIFINGTMPTSKTYVPVDMEYVSKTDNFNSNIYAKLQGTSTLEYPKKNFTIALFKDEARSQKLNKDFKGWGNSNTFVLKADYDDILHARNVVSAKLWSKIVASRSDYDSLPEQLRNSPNNGAIDGFPVKVYINKVYQGLYSLTIPKGAWQFGLDENNANHALINAEINDNGDTELEQNPCNFNMDWTDTGNYPDAWDIEVGTDRTTIQNSWNNIYTKLYDDDITNIENYLDIKSAIDYYIFQDVILGTDGLAKNMLMVTYDMIKWYISAYDLNATFDLSWQGNILNAYNTIMPDIPYLNQYSKLLDFLKDWYQEDMKTRYFELRETVLSTASIIGLFEHYVNVYGDDEYIKDTIPYPDIPGVLDNTLDNLKTFIMTRLDFLDGVYGGE